MGETDPSEAAAPDEFSMHERLDRSYLVMELFGRYVREHQAMDA